MSFLEWVCCPALKGNGPKEEKRSSRVTFIHTHTHTTSIFLFPSFIIGRRFSLDYEPGAWVSFSVCYWCWPEKEMSWRECVVNQKKRDGPRGNKYDALPYTSPLPPGYGNTSSRRFRECGEEGRKDRGKWRKNKSNNNKQTKKKKKHSERHRWVGTCPEDVPRFHVLSSNRLWVS